MALLHSFLPEEYLIYTYHIFLFHSSVSGHLGYSQFAHMKCFAYPLYSINQIPLILQRPPEVILLLHEYFPPSSNHQSSLKHLRAGSTLAPRYFRLWNRAELASTYTQFSSVQSLSCVRLCDPMNCSMPGLLVHHQLPEFTQTHVHRVGDGIQPSHPLSSPSPAPNPSQHQSLFQSVNSSHEVAKVLEFQL